MLTNRIMAASYNTGIRYVGGVVGLKNGSTSGYTTLSITNLQGGESPETTANDIVIACFVVGGNGDQSLSITDGTNEYTLIGTELFRSGRTPNVNLRLAYKKLSSKEDTVSFGPTGNSLYAGALAVHVWRGVDTTTPLDVSPVTATNASSDEPDPPAITPITSGAIIIAAGGAGVSGVGGFGAPDLSNFINEGTNTSQGAVVGIGSYEWESGSFNPAQWIGSGTSSACWAAITLALRPAI